MMYNDKILLFKLNFILEKNIYWIFKLLISSVFLKWKISEKN